MYDYIETNLGVWPEKLQIFLYILSVVSISGIYNVYIFIYRK